MRFIFLIFITTVVLLFNGCASNTYNLKVTQAQALIDSRQYEQAKSDINKLIETYPDEFQPYLLFGLINYILGNYNECLINFDKAEELIQESKLDNDKSEDIAPYPEYFTFKGIALYHTGNVGEAERNLRQSIEFTPTAATYKYLGIIQYETADYAGAVSSLKEALSEFSDDPQTLFSLGDALFREGNNSEALNIFLRASELNPKDETLKFQVATLYMLNEKYNEAIRIYISIPPESPYYYQGLYNCSEAYIRTGHHSTAVNILKMYVKLHPNDHQALYNLAASYLIIEDYVSAIEILTSLYEADKFDIRVSYNLGLAYEGIGAYMQALDHLSFAVEQDPENIRFRYAYGISLMESGDNENAEKQMHAILSIDPVNESASDWLEQFSSSKENNEETLKEKN